MAIKHYDHNASQVTVYNYYKQLFYFDIVFIWKNVNKQDTQQIR